jgi:hypothetical protein
MIGALASLAAGIWFSRKAIKIHQQASPFIYKEDLIADADLGHERIDKEP